MEKRNRSPGQSQPARWFFPLAFMGLTLGASAEILHLNDGTKVEGVVKRNGDGYDLTDASGKLTHFSADEVKRIEIGAKTAGVVETESRLQSLRRSVENLGDIKTIIERYLRFLEQNKDSPIAREAERDLANWQDRQAKGMVKVGPRWVTLDERDQIKKNGLLVAAEARQLLQQGRMKEADPMLLQALEEDPGNVSAAYLRGVLLYRQEQLPAARKCFEAVAAVLSDHGPTLNNLAVLHWHQNQALPALGYYIQAMIAAPQQKEILNNVAEALNALPAAQRASTPAKKAFGLFADQDLQLQQKMAESGLYRWGSTWVEKAKLEKLQAAEKEIQKQLDQMSADYDAMKKKIAGIESDIDVNTRRMKALVDTSYTRDSSGNLIQLPLPRRYYDLERENTQLAADRDALTTKLGDLRTAAKGVQQQMSLPRFTAMQQLIGPEGTPLLPPMKVPFAPLQNRPDLAPPRDIDVIPAFPKPSTRPASPASQPSTQPVPRGKIPDSLLSPS